MNKIKLFTLMLMMGATFSSFAQFSQDRPKNEYMLKVEAGYLHNVGNTGTPEKPATNPTTPNGYYLNAHEEGVGINVINGINISQDFFLGFGVGYAMAVPVRPFDMGKSSNIFQGFVDFDFRPIQDNWAPMLGGRLGYSMMMNPNNYGTTMSPVAEFYGGINWFYDHSLQQMDKNYHSLYLQAGIQLIQQTLFIPIRIGWRL